MQAALFGAVIKTIDGGNTWTIISPGVTTPINRIFVKNTNTVYVVGDFGRSFVSTNAGSNWNFITTGTTHSLKDIVINEFDERGVIVGWNNTILRTTNDGNSWANSNSGAPFANWNRVIKRDDEFYVAGERVITSIDYGENWTEISTTAPGQFSTVTYFDIDKYTDRIVLGGTGGGLNLSTNNGATFEALGNDLYTGIIRDADF
jgi:hypothetical protein